MSDDTVDDLHGAEDFAGSCVAVLEEIVREFHDPSGPGAMDGLVSRAAVLVDGWVSYCRPSCGAHGDPEFEDCSEDDCCGCPCGHRDLAEDGPTGDAFVENLQRLAGS